MRDEITPEMIDAGFNEFLDSFKTMRDGSDFLRRKVIKEIYIVMRLAHAANRRPGREDS